MTTQMGNLEEGVVKFERIVEANQEELQTSDLRYLYETDSTKARVRPDKRAQI